MPMPLPLSVKEVIAFQREASTKHLKFQPPCSCHDCLRQYRSPDQLGKLFSYEGHLTPQEVQQVTASYKRAIHDDQLFIHAALSLHGETILKKWRRDRNVREKWLRQVYPDIPPRDTPLVHMFANGGATAKDRPKPRPNCLLPYITLESLVEDAGRMIGLLFYRATVPPEKWVAFDDSELQEGWKWGVFTEKSGLGCIKLHGSDFGSLKTFDADDVHRRVYYGTPRALLILEAQTKLLQVLRRLVTAVLDDEAKILHCSNASDISQLRIGDKVARFLACRQMPLSPRPAFGRVYSEQPFVAAPEFDIDELISIAGDRFAEKQDELWLLQTDLEYVHERIRYHQKNWSDRGQQLGMPLISVETASNSVAYMISLRAAIEVRNWKWICEECEDIKKKAIEAGGFREDIAELPQAYEKALGYLLLQLEQELRGTQRSIEKAMWRSPAFQRHFHFKVWKMDEIPVRYRTTDIPLEERMGVVLKEPWNLYHQDRVAWCLMLLTMEPGVDLDMPPHAVNLGYDHHIILQHLDSYLASQPHKESQRIDSEMCYLLADLTAVERMIDLLDFHRPRFQTLEPEDMPKDRKVWLAKHEFARDQLMNVDQLGLGPACERLLGSFPKGKKDGNWFIQRDKAHQMLCHLWSQVRDKYQIMYTRVSVPMTLLKPELLTMKQCDSLDLKAQLEQEKLQFSNHLDKLEPSTLSSNLDNNLYLRDEAPTSPTINTDIKIKPKTRPEKIQGNETPDKVHAEEQEMSAPKILYNLDDASIAWKVLPLLFPHPTDSSIRKAPIEWVDFFRTIRELGFLWSHHGGSIVTFRGEIPVVGESLPQKRSIDIHKPHHPAEMGPVFVRTIGRRFNRRFGWDRGCFGII